MEVLTGEYVREKVESKITECMPSHHQLLQQQCSRKLAVDWAPGLHLCLTLTSSEHRCVLLKG